jgi:hypothetical protein
MQDQVDVIRNVLLSKKPSFLTTNRSHVRVRCPYCGDSRKSPNSAHLYVKMAPPFEFYCQRCDTGGVLNAKVLRELEIYNNEASMSIIEANKNIERVSGIQKISVRKYKPRLNTVENEYSVNSVHYLNHRYGLNLDNDYIVNSFKAITNVDQFFKDNNIRYPVDQYGRQMYDFYNSIGFLSSDGSHVIFRDITGQQAKRYYNLNLFNEPRSTSNKLYNIKTELDILQDEINLIITEGVFDIIGVYEHFYKNNINNGNYIFAAAAGKGYGAVISHYIQMGFLNLNITIYSDADVDPGFFRELKKNLIYIKNSPLTIYYNTREKDFGVPKDRISLRKVII